MRNIRNVGREEALVLSVSAFFKMTLMTLEGHRSSPLLPGVLGVGGWSGPPAGRGFRVG